MKTKLLVVVFFVSFQLFAQVGVNTTTPNPSSMLDVSATNKGVLFPRVSLSNINVTQLDGVNTAATGLLIWNTNAATVGGNGVGYYYFNGTIWVPVMQTASSDHDWYEVGTTVAPNAITDNMFHNGNVVIGKNTLDISNPKLDIENSTPALTTLKVTDLSTGTGLHQGINLNMNSTTAASEWGILVSHNNANAPLKYGISSWVQNGSGTNSAFQGRVTGTGTNTGSHIQIFDSGSPSSALQTGYSSLFQQPTSQRTYGAINTFSSNNLSIDTGNKYGFYNQFGDTIGGTIYGLYNNFDLVNSSTYDKYGSYTFIPSLSGGTHYGLYSNVTKAGSYAGYFLGNVSIGTTTTNNYILPSARGTNGQIMQTDGTGNVSWVNAPTDTDNQIIDVLSLTGDTLNISLQDDGVATQTLNLAAIDNQATDVFSLTGTTLNLSLQNDGVATQTVDLSTLDTDNQQIDVLTLTGDTLNISLQDDGVATQTLNLAAIDNQATDVFSLTETTLNLSLQNDGVATQTVNLASLIDHDWYEIGTTNGPDAITDNMFHTGNAVIGKSTIDSTNPKLEIENSTTGSTVLKLRDASTGTAAFHRGITLDMQSTTSAGEYGISVLHNNANAPLKYGVYSTVENGSGTNSAFQGRVEGSGLNIGSTIIVFDSGTTNTSEQRGYTVEFQQASTNTTFGLLNTFNSNNLASDTGIKYGVRNEFNSTIGGTTYGLYNYFSPSMVSTTDKYGSFTSIPSTLGGTHYGIYSSATKSGSYAGYFLGQISIGTTTANNYLLPPSRGTNGQIMQTDALGNVTWVNAPIAESTTANNGLTETINNIQLGGTLIQNTVISPSTFNMDINLNNTGDFSIQDNGTDVLFVEDSGEIGIGTNAPAYPLHMVETAAVDNAFYLNKTETSANNTSGIFINKTGQGTGRSHAIFNDVGGTGTGQKYGVFNQISSTAAGNQYGTRNFISGNSPANQFGTFNNLDNAGTGTHYGNYNGMRGTSATILYANYNEFDNATTAANSYGNYTSFSANSTGTGDKYGTYNTINAAIPGTHYGTYNSVDEANGWAGYFLGKNYISERLSIGEVNNVNAALSINKNSTGTYAHIELKESTANDGARLSFSNTAEATNSWLLYGRADNTIADGRFNIFHTTTGNIVQITGDGLFGILRTPTTNQLEVNGTASKSAAGGFLANSDSRLKKNIVTISPTDALNKVLSLRGVTYEWNDDKTGMNRPEGMQLGFVAQEIQQVFPEKVSEDKQGYLQTAYGDYDPIIFQAIKALSDKIDKLEKENEELKLLVKNQK